MVAVYISGNRLQAVVGKRRRGKLNIIRVLELTLPYGSTVGSRIIDVPSVVAALKVLANDKDFSKHSIHIAVDIGAVMTKLLTLPYVSSEKYMHLLAADNFPDGGVVSHTVLRQDDNGLAEVLACMAERELVRNYISTFEKVGLKIASIDLSVCGLIRLTQKCAMLRDSSYAVCVADDTGISRYVFDHGKYRCASRERIYSKRRTEEFAEDTVRSVTALIKLSGGDISNVLLAGFTAEEIEWTRSALADSGLVAARFPAQKEICFADEADISDHLTVVSALM